MRTDLAGLPDRLATGEPVVLRPSRRRKLGSLLLGLWLSLLPFGGVVGLLGGHALGLVALPVAPFVVFWLGVALPRSCALTLTSVGFAVRHCFVTRRWRWEDVTGFRPRTITCQSGGDIALGLLHDGGRRRHAARRLPRGPHGPRHHEDADAARRVRRGARGWPGRSAPAGDASPARRRTSRRRSATSRSTGCSTSPCSSCSRSR